MTVFLVSSAAAAFAQSVDSTVTDTAEKAVVDSELPPPIQVVPELESANEFSDAAVTDEVVAGPSCVNASESLDAFWGYRWIEGWTSWMIGDGDQFGMFSIGANHYRARGIEDGFNTTTRFNFLAGPERTDMPPRVYDFGIGFQKRDFFGTFGYDVACSVIASSDFEGSSREGIRFPSHAVGYLVFTDSIDLVFGVDYLDRGDMKILPVGGLIYHAHPEIRLELVFPRPRIDFQLDDSSRLHVRGELGGNTWAIERDTFVDDVAIYSDLRVCVGFTKSLTVEIVYVFDRQFEYASGRGDYRPNDTLMISLGGQY
jgi:hypothetical protein